LKEEDENYKEGQSYSIRKSNQLSTPNSFNNKESAFLRQGKPEIKKEGICSFLC
jgi:hypothetical protein